VAASIYAMTFVQANETMDETYNYAFDDGRPLRRVYVSAEMSADDLLGRLDRGRPKALPFRDRSSFGSRGWAISAGALRDTEAGRELVSVAGMADGRAEVFLDGSRSWSNYALSACISVSASATLSVIVRRAGPRDYLAVTVSRSYTSIEQVTGDTRRVLSQADVDLTSGGRSPHELLVRVVGRTAELRVDGRTVLNARNVSSTLGRGGVAFRVDPTRGTVARVEVGRLAIVPVRTPSRADAAVIAAPRSPHSKAPINPRDVAL